MGEGERYNEGPVDTIFVHSQCAEAEAVELAHSLVQVLPRDALFLHHLSNGLASLVLSRPGLSFGLFAGREGWTFRGLEMRGEVKVHMLRAGGNDVAKVRRLK